MPSNPAVHSPTSHSDTVPADTQSQALAELEPGARDRLGDWFTRNVPGAEGPLTAELITGGKSNLTYRVRDSLGGTWAVRRPPLGPKAPTAHDVLREHRVIAALHANSALPVPAAAGTCSDDTVIGAPFMVTAFVDGIVIRTKRIARGLSGAMRATAADNLVDVLAQLHQLEPKEIGLADLAPATGYLERQLARWRTQYERSRHRDIPDVDTMHRWLAEHLPVTARPCLVHGDYRLDNVIFDPHAHVAAVLDWEIATIGDPLADLALLVVYWAGPGPEAVGPTSLPGFPDRDSVVAKYAAGSGRDIDDLRWYLAFSYWKLACAAEGIHARYSAGGGGGDRSVRLDQIAELAPTLASRAVATTAR